VLNTPVPVDVLGPDALESAGAVGGELGAALQTLAPSFNFQRQSNSGPADIVRAAQLRGMSPDQTLVLVNGKRRHTTSVVNLESKVGRGATPVDFNSIPLSALRRVEVLRDGAGAQYGSDAIAGVINLMLDTSSEGGEISVTYGAHVTDFTYPVFDGPFSERGTRTDEITDGETLFLTAKAGFNLFDRGFLSLGGEYKDREATRRGGADVLAISESGVELRLDPMSAEAWADRDAADPVLLELPGLPVLPLLPLVRAHRRDPPLLGGVWGSLSEEQRQALRRFLFGRPGLWPVRRAPFEPLALARVPFCLLRSLRPEDWFRRSLLPQNPPPVGWTPSRKPDGP
jgi:outer membrane receptor protein involved in Fe transport